MLSCNGQLTVPSIVSLHATVPGELTSALGETRRRNVMAEGSLHVNMDISLVTGELGMLCQQTKESIG